MTTVATCYFLAIIMVTCHFGNKIYIKINNNNNSNKTILKIQVNLTINFIKYNKFNKLIYLLLIIWFISYSIYQTYRFLLAKDSCVYFSFDKVIFIVNRFCVLIGKINIFNNYHFLKSS